MAQDTPQGQNIGQQTPTGDGLGYWDYTVNPAVFRVVSSTNPLPTSGGGGSAGVYNTTPPTYTNGQTVTPQYTSQGYALVANQTLTPGADATNNTQAVSNKPILSAAYSPTSFIMAQASDVPYKIVKGSAGLILSVNATNGAGTTAVGDVFLQILNTASPAQITSGTTVPIMSWLLPGGTLNSPGTLTFGRDFLSQNGLFLATGVTIAISATQFVYTTPTTGNVTGYATTNYSFAGTYL